MVFGFKEFKELRNFIYEKTGIFIPDNKIYLLQRKVEKALKGSKFKNFEEYIKYLKFYDTNKSEFTKLINEITINETHFFRDFPQLQAFAEYCVPELLERTKKRKIKLLSAGCATGEEPYTLSIICNEMLPSNVDYSIIALDIDDNALKKAKEGSYLERSVKFAPKKYLNKYFIKYNDSYYVREEIKNNVSFYKVNLFDSSHLLSFGSDFDFIFCRNVLIYFSEISRIKVVSTFYNMLEPGGYIFLGSSESLSRITTAFELKKMGEFLVYQKPLSKEGRNL